MPKLRAKSSVGKEFQRTRRHRPQSPPPKAPPERSAMLPDMAMRLENAMDFNDPRFGENGFPSKK